MKKIPNVFERDWAGDSSRVLPIVLPECQWVADGEGVATRKWDGTACLVAPYLGAVSLFKRYDAKHGKTPPDGFMPAQDPDPKTGHWPGWLMVMPEKREDQWHVEAWLAQRRDGTDLSIGTYELCGPKVGGNPEHFDSHRFIRHGADVLDMSAYMHRPFTERIACFLSDTLMEGIVFHHPDGRMAKVKRRDFGLPWPVKA